RAASALGALTRRAEYLKDAAAMTRTMRDPLPTILDLDDLLTAYNIPTAPLRLATSVGEATAIADEIGYPIVMKIASPDIPHKSDAGGVVLDIRDALTLLNAYTQIMKSVRKAKPDARINGIHLQRQVPQGQEVIVGAVRDPQFGPLMMFGSGGVEVEGLQDVSFALAPLTEAEASRMIRRTWAGRKLSGFRNIPPADEASVVDILVRLSQLVMDQEWIEELEINPLRVLAHGAVAVDVRMKPHGTH
ncbi:MAG: acetate--CoA ligase family protein, partial [Syntrophothermus sp.]